MNTNFLCNHGMNEDDFPPIGSTNSTNIKSVETNSHGTEDTLSYTQHRFSPEKEIVSTNLRSTPPLNKSSSPNEAFLRQCKDLDFTMKPRNKVISTYQPRVRALNNVKTSPPLIDLEPETDSSIISRREKQIEYGKSTPAYERYINQVPKNARTFKMPHTPEKTKKYSRRQFDGMVKIWKIKIHEWDLLTNGEKFRESSQLFHCQTSPDNNSNNDTSMGDDYYEALNYFVQHVEKTPTEKAIEKSIMDWRDEYRVKEKVQEMPELSMVQKYKLGSPSNYSL